MTPLSDCGSISAVNVSVVVFGKPNLYNEMLTYVLEREMEAEVVIAENISLHRDNVSGPDADKRLFLVDYHTESYDQILSALSMVSSEAAGRSVVALFNLARDTGLEQRAIRRGVKGFFYEGDTLYLVLKGIEKLMEGEIWAPREMLYSIAQGHDESDDGNPDDHPNLTKREMQVLGHVCMGLSNDEIASALNLSPHTIKTHLYRIFKKINVENRFQASLWASKNL